MSHPYQGLHAWAVAEMEYRIQHPEVSHVAYRATDKDAERLSHDLCGCSGGELLHTDYSSGCGPLAGTWQGVAVYRGADSSRFEGL